MKAWLLREIGDVDHYELTQIDDPAPGPGEATVRLKTSALNHMDLWVARGKPAPPLPHVPGADGAGVIQAVGVGVHDVSVGDEVIINPALGCGSCERCANGEEPLCAQLRIIGEHVWGTHADLVTVPARNLHPKPEGLGWTEAAAFGMATGNAYRLLRRARLAAGETVLVVGFGGGVSSAGLLVARALGAKGWVTTRDPAKGQKAMEFGAEGWFDSDAAFDEQVRDATGGQGVDVVFENVGPATWDRSLKALARGGRLATCGGTSGSGVALNLPLLFWRHLEIVGASAVSNREFAEVTAMVAAGRIPVLVDTTVGFADYPGALTRLSSGGQMGKLVLLHDLD